MQRHFYRSCKSHHHIGSKCLYFYRNIDRYTAIIFIFTVPSYSIIFQTNFLLLSLDGMIFAPLAI